MKNDIYDQINIINEKIDEETGEKLQELEERKRLENEAIQKEKEQEEQEKARLENEKRDAERLEYKKKREERQAELKPKAEEFLKGIITSKDPRLDQIAWIKTSPNSDFVEPTELDRPLTVREALLCKLIERPFPTYRARSWNTQLWNNIELNPDLSEEQIIKAKEYLEKKNAIKSLSNSSIGTSLDEPGAIQIPSFYFKEGTTVEEYIEKEINGNNERNNGESEYVSSLSIELTQRELLQLGLDPRDFDWKSLEQIKTEKITPRDIAETAAVRGIVKRDLITVEKTPLFEKIINKFKGLLNRNQKGKGRN